MPGDFLNGLKLILENKVDNRKCAPHFSSTSSAQPDKLKVIEVAVGDREILTRAMELAEFFLNSDGTAFEPALGRGRQN